MPRLPKLMDWVNGNFCFDIGHAYQVDPSGGIANQLLEAYSRRLVQVHLSYVDNGYKHNSVRERPCLKELIEGLKGTPIILESPVEKGVLAI